MPDTLEHANEIESLVRQAIEGPDAGTLRAVLIERREQLKHILEHVQALKHALEAEREAVQEIRDALSAMQMAQPLDYGT